MFRHISILALIQLLLVILGFSALSIVLKVDGYPHDPPFMASLGWVVWSPLTLLVHRDGLVLLFVPMIWGILAALSQNRRVIFSPEVWLMVGVLVAVVIIVLFLYACIHRYAVVPN